MIRHRSALVSLMLLLAYVVACESSEPDRFTVGPDTHGLVAIDGTPAQELIGTLDLIIGVEDGADPYMFSVVASVIRDPAGRIVVADRHSDQVRVFSPEGEFLFHLGGSGAGPGELRNPCCLAQRDDELWVRDAGNGRISVFRLQSHAGTYLQTTHAPFFGSTRYPAPIAFHPAGDIIDVRNFVDWEDGRIGFERHVIDGQGRSLAVQRVLPPPEQRVPTYRFASGSRTSRSGGIFFPIFGPTHLLAHAPDGDWAEAVSTDYTILWYDADGNLRRIITRDIGPGPPLTRAERERAEAAWRRFTENSPVRGEAPVPDNKPVLRELAFDRDGNLWVMLAQSTGGYRRADVVSPNGEYLAEVRWESRVDVARGAVDLTGLVGVVRGGFGVEHIGVVRFAPVEDGPDESGAGT